MFSLSLSTTSVPVRVCVCPFVCECVYGENVKAYLNSGFYCLFVQFPPFSPPPSITYLIGCFYSTSVYNKYNRKKSFKNDNFVFSRLFILYFIYFQKATRLPRISNIPKDFFFLGL